MTLVPIRGKQENVRIGHLEILSGHITRHRTHGKRHIPCFGLRAPIQRSELPALVQCKLQNWGSSWELVKL